MNNILNEIRQLEKLIARTVIKDSCQEDKIEKLSLTQMQIMRYIIKNKDEGVYQKDLEEILKLRRATVSGVLQTMEKNNLIVRRVCPEDTRTKKIYLNSKAKEKAKEIFKKGINKSNELEKIAINGISDEDLNIFMNVIHKMRENIESSFED